MITAHTLDLFSCAVLLEISLVLHIIFKIFGLLQKFLHHCSATF